MAEALNAAAARPSVGAGSLLRAGVLSIVATAAVLALVVGGAQRRSSTDATAQQRRHVIAVLPLANLSGDPARDFLGVGIADALTTGLARLTSVSVVDRSSAADSSRQIADRSTLAQELGATLFVEGSVQQAGEQLRVTAKLVKPDGQISWAGGAEAAVSDLFALETRLAADLMGALQVTVTPDARRQALQPPTSDRAALNDYYHAITLLDRRDPEGLERAIASLERATARDARFDLAYASLGTAYLLMYTRTNDRAWVEKAVDAAAAAVQIGPDRVQARMSLAAVYGSTGRRSEAIDELRRVIAIEPANDDAHRQLGELLREEGRPDEAQQQMQEALRLRPQYWRNHASAGVFFLQQGKLADAVQAFTRVVELHGGDSRAYLQLGTAYHQLGERTQALEAYERSIAIRPTGGAYSNIGTLYYAEGRYADAATAYEAAIKLLPNRPLYRRNLGDAYQKLGRSKDATTEYSNAVRQAEQAVSVNPRDATALSQLAVYEAKLGRRQDATRHSTTALALNPTSPDVLYRQAVVLALNGDTTGAMHALSDAVKYGYSISVVREDDDLVSLRPLPAFQTLTSH